MKNPFVACVPFCQKIMTSSILNPYGSRNACFHAAARGVAHPIRNSLISMIISDNSSTDLEAVERFTRIISDVPGRSAAYGVFHS